MNLSKIYANCLFVILAALSYFKAIQNRRASAALHRIYPQSATRDNLPLEVLYETLVDRIPITMGGKSDELLGSSPNRWSAWVPSTTI